MSKEQLKAAETEATAQAEDGVEEISEEDLDGAEVAFYDALSNNQSAHDLMGDEVLMKMARELAEKLRGNLSID